MEKSLDIATLIKDLTISSENLNTGEIKERKHGDFAYVAKHSNNQFHGYLFVDENIATINSQEPFRVDKLLKEERELIEVGHRTILRFVELCLSDFTLKSPVVAKCMNPYSIFKEVTYDISNELLLSDDEMQTAVKAFKTGKIYRILLDSDLTKLFDNVSLENMLGLIEVIGKELQKSYNENSNTEIDKFALKIMNGYNNLQDVMYAASILIFALKESLRMTCSLFYQAICGDDLIVLNNDNIINIENRFSNCVVEHYKVLIQDIFLNVSGDSMGSVLLIDCETMYGEKIHEFGMIIASSISFVGEMGNTTKYSFLTIDDELVSIHNITNLIIEKDLPKLIDKRRQDD